MSVDTLDSVSGEVDVVSDRIESVSGDVSLATEKVGTLIINQNFEGSYVGTAFPPPETPSPADDDTQSRIQVVGGEYGPTDQALVPSGVPCGLTSLQCRYLEFSLVDFEPGDYEIRCEFDGWDEESFRSPRQFGSSLSVTVNETGELSGRGQCFINFDRLGGPNGVRLVASGPILLAEDGSKKYGGSINSEWTKETRELAPRATT